jgi:hypothetical protein
MSKKKFRDRPDWADNRAVRAEVKRSEAADEWDEIERNSREPNIVPEEEFRDPNTPTND